MEYYRQPNAGGLTAMKLELSIINRPFIVQEPIHLDLCLVNGDTPVPIPSAYDTGDVVTALLYDAHGQSLGAFNSYTQEIRLGLTPALVKQSTMRTETMPAGERLQWFVDLCSYTDLWALGRYSVEVEFSFQPAGVLVRSNRVDFELCANQVKARDTVLDFVATPVLHTAQVNESEDECRLLFHFRSVHGSHNAWSGGTMEWVPGQQPRIAEANFASRASFEHDFARWLAWVTTDNQLGLRRFHESYGPEDNGWEPLRTHPLPDKATLLGRPIQQADTGVSVLIAHEQETGRWQIDRLRFDAQGTGVSDELLTRLSLAAPGPAVSGSDTTGTTYIACGDAGQLPLTLIGVKNDGGVESQAVLDAGIVERSLTKGRIWIKKTLVGIRLELKTFSNESTPYVLAAVLLSNNEGSLLWIARASIEELSQKNAWRAQSFTLPKELLHADEKVAKVDLVSNADGRLEALIIMSSGRLLLFRDEELRDLYRKPHEAAEYASLFVIGSDTRLISPVPDKGLEIT
jgi:hypothetical protein